MSVLAAGNRDELLAEVVGFTKRLGFETVSAMTVIDHFRAESEFITIDNTPAAYRKAFADFNSGRRDPVMQHCKHHSVPIIWNQDTYTSIGQGDKWEMQASYGYRCGIAMALHLPDGRHFQLGV
ncbi:MAG TPA: autoinducer binding domain-containing protein, partial [Albitalea sp.]|nr:autoinducer binding domain-containing protein [Albitalea sp.]